MRFKSNMKRANQNFKKSKIKITSWIRSKPMYYELRDFAMKNIEYAKISLILEGLPKNSKENLGKLYLGNVLCPQDLSALQKYNIGAVVSLVSKDEHIAALQNMPYIINEENRRIQKINKRKAFKKIKSIPNAEYFTIKLDDRIDTQIIFTLKELHDYIHGKRTQGINVLVHCEAGVSRSATVVISYVMAAHDLRFKDALKYVRTRRFFVNPNAGFTYQLALLQFNVDYPLFTKRGNEVKVAKLKEPNLNFALDLKDEEVEKLFAKNAKKNKILT